MIDRKEIDLLIRAQLKGGKTIEQVTRSISDLEKAIKSQADAAGRGESSIDELTASLKSLQSVQDQLRGQADLVGGFQKTADAIDRANDRLERAKKRYDEYNAVLQKSSDVTDKQQERLIRYATAVERAESNLDKQIKNRNALADSLREAGIATDELAAAEERLRANALDVGVQIDRVNTAIDGFAANLKRVRDESKKKAAEDKRAAEEAALFAQAEERAAKATRERADAAADAARIVANRRADSVAAGLQFETQAEDATRARTLAALKEDIIRRSEEQLALEKELARNSSLAKTADDAQQAARSYETLGKAARDLTPKTKSLKDTIAGILDPSKGLSKSLKEVENDLDSLASSVSKINGPIRNYKDQLRQLKTIGADLAQRGALVDNFREQASALRTARSEFVTARADVAKYAAEVRKGGDSGAQFTAKLREASVAADRAAQALARQLASTRQAREALRSAGVATNDLAGAEKRLTDATTKSVGAIRQLTVAMQKHGEAAQISGRKLGFFRDEGRTTLSLMQRIRGEVLALAAGYVGLQGAIGLAGDSLRAFGTREGIKNQLALSVGNDRAAIDEEYDYVKQQSERIGIEFESASRGYAKFAAAAAQAGRTRKEIRYIWEAFAEVGRVANLTTENMDGVYKALEQVVSKGKIQAEELRGQLGDRLFGAFQIAAKALEDQFPDLDKAMKNGEVSAKQLVLIAEEYRKTVADQLPAATKSLFAEQARLNNAVLDFKLALADGGFAASYTDLIKKLTEFLRSDDGAKFAQALSDGFSTLADWLVFLLNHLDEVATVAKIVAGYFGLMVTGNVIRSFIQLGETVVHLGTYLKKVGVIAGEFGAKWPVLAKIVKSAFGLMGAAMLGWQVGKWANEEFAVVRKAGVALVTGLDIVWTRIKYGAKILWEEIPRYAKNAFALILNTVTSGMRGILTTFAKGLSAIGKDDLAGYLNSTAETLTAKYEQQGSQVKALKAQMERDIAGIKQIGQRMFDQAEKSREEIKKAEADNAKLYSTAKPTGRPDIGDTGNTGGAGPSDSDINKRARKIESITKGLEGIEARIDRAQTDTLARQLDAVDVEYAALARKIQALGGETGRVFMERLISSTADLKQQLTEKFNKQLADEQEALQNKIEDLEAKAGKKSKFELDRRLEAVVTSYQDTYRQIEEYRAKLAQNNISTAPADLAKQRLDAGIKQLQNVERIKFATEELNRLEKETNDLIELRNKKIDLIREQKERLVIGDIEAAQRINQINQESIPVIQAAADATRDWALSHQAIFGNPEQMQLFIDQLDILKVRAEQVKTEFTDFQKIAGAEGSQVINQGLELVTSGLEDIVSGQKSVAEGWEDIRRGAIGIFAQFLKDVALAIIKLAIFNAMKNSGYAPLQAIGAAGAASVSVNHAGGIVGSRTGRRRSVDPTIFANAPRYHSGGIAGIAPDEYPTILKKNEEVLTEDSPRNILNGGADVTGQQKSQQPGYEIRNFFDPIDFMSQAADTPAGRQVIFNVIASDPDRVRKLIGN